MKSIWSSRTFWFNVLSGVALFFALPELAALLPMDAIRYIVLAQAAINIVLRYITTQPIA